jgi:3-isopropylmalate/(R)-2-methylmalate dehydratase small subunit
VIAPSFGDIFFNNCFKNGLLPIVLPAEQAAALRTEFTQHPGRHAIVDLERQEVIAPSKNVHRFEVDSFRKQCLLQGLDEIAFTLGHDADIAAFERRQVDELRCL